MDPGEAHLLFRAIPPSVKQTAEQRRELVRFARELAGLVSNAVPFTCLITNDKALRQLNLKFLQHDYPTDVLSFPALAGSSHLGEIAISIERASAQAVQHGHSCSEEIKILMLHGVLHLLGLDHETDRGKMARTEERWRAKFSLPQSLVARSRAVAGLSRRAKDVA